jgi:hypothetical protein
MGDLNARTGQESDFIENKEHDSNIPLFDDYTPDFNIINRYPLEYQKSFYKA